MADNSGTIDRFMKAWNSLDLDAVMDHFTEDASYANVPMGPPNVGKAAIRAFIEGFLSDTTEINFIVHQQVEGSDGVVMNERTRVELPVMGVFEFRDGKISAWRDYFDMAGFA